MTRRLHQVEALTLIADAWNSDPDSYTEGLVEATVVPLSVEQARADVDSYLARIDDQIDPDSIEIIADRLEDSDLCATRIIIHLEV